MRTLDGFEKQWRKKRVPKFDIGDTIDVHVKIIEGDKERIQIFSGTVLARRHQGLSETFTVRRIVQGEGVERVFPLHSPRLVKIDVKKKGKVRRAKLHYLRDRVGRATKVQEKIGGEIGETVIEEVAEAPVDVPEEKAPAEATEEKAEEKTEEQAKEEAAQK